MSEDEEKLPDRGLGVIIVLAMAVVAIIILVGATS